MVTNVNMTKTSKKVQLCPATFRSQAQEKQTYSKQMWSPLLTFTLTFICPPSYFFPVSLSGLSSVPAHGYIWVSLIYFFISLVSPPSLYYLDYGLFSSKHYICSDKLSRTFLISHIPGSNSSLRSNALDKE